MQRFLRIGARKLSTYVNGAVLLTSVAILTFGQAQTLPPSAPAHPVATSPSQTTAPALPLPAAPVAPAQQPASRARVEIVNGKLAINAENSSLDQILSDIAHLNGMKITGGVSDERVFGAYGPGSQQEVIAQLLDGTNSNVLILQNPSHGVSELVLSPRNGGPTPPSPSLYRPGDRENSDLPTDPARRRGGLPDFPQRRQFGFQRPPEGAQPPAAPNGLGPPNPDAGTTTQQPPNGVKTPQQIYNDLVRAQQQAAQNPQ